MEDPRPSVVGHEIRRVGGVDRVHVGPESGALVVVGIGVTHDQTAGLGELGATALPFPEEAPSVVGGDLGIFDHDVRAGVARDSELAVVVGKHPADHGRVAGPDPGRVVETGLDILDDPACSQPLVRRLQRLDRPVLGRHGVLLDNEVADDHVGGVTHEGM